MVWNRFEVCCIDLRKVSEWVLEGIIQDKEKYKAYLSKLNDGFDIEVGEDEENHVFWEGEQWHSGLHQLTCLERGLLVRVGLET